METHKISETEAKAKSEFIRQVMAFGEYQKGEIEDSRKGFLIIAVDPDAMVDDSAMSLAMMGGNRKALFAALCQNLEQPSAIRDMLRKAMTEIAMKGILEELFRKKGNG